MNNIVKLSNLETYVVGNIIMLFYRRGNSEVTKTMSMASREKMDICYSEHSQKRHGNIVYG